MPYSEPEWPRCHFGQFHIATLITNVWTTTHTAAHHISASTAANPGCGLMDCQNKRENAGNLLLIESEDTT
jgi:hypothetical protein